MGLEFTKSGQKWVDVENLEVEIARPSSGDFGPALDAIFTEEFSSFAPSLPSYWQRFAQCNLFPAADPGKVPLFCQPGIKPDKSAKQVGGSVSAPQLGEHAEAEFNRFARRVKYTGTSVVGMIVDETGQPSRLRVVTPAGLGLDEQALAAVERWHFTPALQNGNPVKVEVNVEVNFKIY